MTIFGLHIYQAPLKMINCHMLAVPVYVNSLQRALVLFLQGTSLHPREPPTCRVKVILRADLAKFNALLLSKNDTKIPIRYTLMDNFAIPLPPNHLRGMQEYSRPTKAGVLQDYNKISVHFTPRQCNG